MQSVCSLCPKLRIAVIFVKTQTFVCSVIQTWALSRSKRVTTATDMFLSSSSYIPNFLRPASRCQQQFTNSRTLSECFKICGRSKASFEFKSSTGTQTMGAILFKKTFAGSHKTNWQGVCKTDGKRQGGSNQPCNFDKAARGRRVQCRPAFVVTSVNVGTTLNEKFHYFKVVVNACLQSSNQCC